jgi:hypothetical protein
MSELKGRLKVALSLLTFRVDDSIVDRCVELYTSLSFEDPTRFADSLDAFMFTTQLSTINAETLDKFAKDASKVKPKSDDDDGLGDFCALDDDELAGIIGGGFAGDATSPATPPSSSRSVRPTSPLLSSDRKRPSAVDETPASRARRNDSMSTPITSLFASPASTAPRKSESGKVVCTLESRVAETVKKDLFTIREESVSPISVVDLAKHMVDMKKSSVLMSADGEAASQAQSTNADNGAAAPMVDMISPNTSSFFAASASTDVSEPLANLPVPTQVPTTAPPFRHMRFDRLANLKVLDKRSDDLVDDILLSPVYAKHADPNGVEITDVNHATNTESFFIGRICDGNGESNKLVTDHLSIRGISRDRHPEVGIRLGHPDIKQCAFFPGQTVVIRGTNPTGQNIVANAIFQEAPLPAYSRKDLGLPAADEDRSVSVVYAAGPYSTSTENALGMLLEAVIEKTTVYPDVLILSGPFVDEDTPALTFPKPKEADTSFDMPVPIFKNESAGAGQVLTYDEIFKALVDELNEKLSQVDAPTKVILVPSLKDLHHVTCMPQCPFAYNPNPDRFLCVANPSMIDINGVLFAVSSHDSLMDIARHELYHKSHLHVPSAEPSTSIREKRVVRLLSHFLNQHTFFPLSVVPVDRVLAERAGAAVDFTHRPDIMLMSSKLKHFTERVPVPGDMSSLNEPSSVKVEDTVVAVNAESLVKGNNPAMYARIIINAGTASVADRTQVDIIKV